MSHSRGYQSSADQKSGPGPGQVISGPRTGPKEIKDKNPDQRTGPFRTDGAATRSQ